jgi:hypothetical protein
MHQRIAASLTLLALAAVPASALSIPVGKDFWVTPPNGATNFEFKSGEVESLCGAPADDSWDHTVLLTGVPVVGTDYDTVVGRLDKAVFNSSGTATTRIQVSHLAFKSLAPQRTPCGEIDWEVGLFGRQPVTSMTLRQTSDRGGIFLAKIAVSVEFRAHVGGAYIGSLYYNNLELPDVGTPTGTPWSLNPATGAFRAGMDTTENCIDVLRAKLVNATGRHIYYISDMIAQGRCEKGR